MIKYSTIWLFFFKNKIDSYLINSDCSLFDIDMHFLFIYLFYLKTSKKLLFISISSVDDIGIKLDELTHTVRCFAPFHHVEVSNCSQFPVHRQMHA